MLRDRASRDNATGVSNQAKLRGREMPFIPQAEIFSGNGKAVVRAAGWISAVLLVITVVVAVLVVVVGGPKYRAVIYGFAALWAIGAPVWFWYEYFYVYRRYGAVDTIEHYKQGLQVSVAIWAGVALTLGALASSDLLKPSEIQNCGNSTSRTRSL
jgi:hypothetical protein